MPEIKINSLCKSFGKITAINNCSLTIGHGELLVLLGPTGAGKTTLIRLISGLENVDSGDISIDGKNVSGMSPALRDVACIFQQYSLYPHLNVYDNLAFPLRSPIRKLDERIIRSKVEQIAKLVRIDHKLSNESTRLSGGEMQRVAIGRALVRNPSIYLMDEPLSSLDAKLRSELRVELKRIHSELDATILYVTHDQTEAMSLADRIGILQDGKLIQVGSPHTIYNNPCNRHVASRLGHPPINFLPAIFLEYLSDQSSVPHGVESFGVRGEYVELTRDANGAGTITLMEHLGADLHVHLSLNGHQMVALARPEQNFSMGDQVKVHLFHPIYFNHQGERVV